MSERILVTGSREWAGTWEDIAVHFPESGDVTIIHGACSRRKTIVSFGKTFHDVEVSVDMLADFAARGLGFNVERFRANWSIGNSAGPKRNALMLAEGKPDRALAFGALYRLSEIRGAAPLPSSTRTSGTGDMVKKLLAAGIPVRWIAAPGADAVDLTAMPAPPVTP